MTVGLQCRWHRACASKKNATFPQWQIESVQDMDVGHLGVLVAWASSSWGSRAFVFWKSSCGPQELLSSGSHHLGSKSFCRLTVVKLGSEGACRLTVVVLGSKGVCRLAGVIWVLRVFVVWKSSSRVPRAFVVWKSSSRDPTAFLSH